MDAGQLRSRINSMLGLLSHYRSYHLRKLLFFPIPAVFHCGYYQCGMMKYTLSKPQRGVNIIDGKKVILTK